MAEPRRVCLDINDSGAWRRVTSFDLNTFNDGDLTHYASALLQLSSSPKLRARIIPLSDTTAPLMTWSKTDGWRE